MKTKKTEVDFKEGKRTIEMTIKEPHKKCPDLLDELKDLQVELQSLEEELLNNQQVNV
jgi:hypothetical protein